jgi:hypothetical protein
MFHNTNSLQKPLFRILWAELHLEFTRPTHRPQAGKGASHDPPPERGLAVRRRNKEFMGIMQFQWNWPLPMNRLMLGRLMVDGFQLGVER